MSTVVEYQTHLIVEMAHGESIEPVLDLVLNKEEYAIDFGKVGSEKLSIVKSKPSTTAGYTASSYGFYHFTTEKAPALLWFKEVCRAVKEKQLKIESIQFNYICPTKRHAEDHTFTSDYKHTTVKADNDALYVKYFNEWYGSDEDE